MPQLFFAINDLHVMTPGDVRDARRAPSIMPWRARQGVVDFVKEPLRRCGFVLTEPIYVYESLSPVGFVFTQ